MLEAITLNGMMLYAKAISNIYLLRGAKLGIDPE
jgi:hypothetical protein